MGGCSPSRTPPLTPKKTPPSPRGTSLAGAALCLGLMLVTCWYCALLALGIGATAYKYLEYRG